jgi:hypothetical protein
VLSQGVDLDNDLLVYACAGMVVDPNLAAATAAASAADAATAADMQPITDAAVVAEGAKHHHHHHHHHHRHLLQTNLEFTGTWLVRHSAVQHMHKGLDRSTPQHLFHHPNAQHHHAVQTAPLAS